MVGGGGELGGPGDLHSCQSRPVATHLERGGGGRGGGGGEGRREGEGWGEGGGGLV